MAPKISLLLSYALFLFLSLVFSHAKPSEVAVESIPSWSAFDFIKPLQGSKKGDKVEGLYNLKKYLKTFGYIDDTPYNNSSPEADYFSEQMESGVKTYQTNFNLNSTGVLDSDTISQMMKPRCGVPDIINGQIQPLYSFFPGNPKWNKDVLKYAIWADGTPPKFFSPIDKAILGWFGWTPLSFDNDTDYQSADLKFHLFARSHGDNLPFDGPGGILAHAFRPTVGICHFDSEENWSGSDDTPSNAVDIQTVAMHEIGHMLGLQHSKVESAVMYPALGYGEMKRSLGDDDINGIRYLYPEQRLGRHNHNNLS